MSTPKSLLGTLVSKIAAEKDRLFEQVGKPSLTRIGAVMLVTAVGSACLYGEARLAMKVFPSFVNVATIAEAPTNIAEAAAAVDKSLDPYLEISDSINGILRRGLGKIASTDLSSLSPNLANRTIRQMADETLGDIPGIHDRPLETAANSFAMAGSSPEKIKEIAHSGQVTAGFEAMLKAIVASKDVSPDVLHKLAVSALNDAGAEVPALAHLDLLGAIEKANDQKALALHEIQDELKSLKGDKEPDYPQASRELTESALSGLHGDSSAERIAVMVLAKAEMAAGGEHGAEVTAAYNKGVSLDAYFTEVVGKYVDGDMEPATFAELTEKAQAQLTAFESADASPAHKM